MLSRGGRTTKLFTKGLGVFGALGKGHLNDAKGFEEVPLGGLNVRNVAAGWGHSAAVSDHGELLIFGRPYDFQSLMRINSLYNVFKPMGRFVSNLTPKFGETSGVFETPQVVSSTSSFDPVSKAYVSGGLTSFLTVNGDVFVFGQNRWGQCAVPNKSQFHVYAPTKVDIHAPVVSLDIGLQHCVAVTNGGLVYAWGKGNRGQLGNGDWDSTYIPLLVNRTFDFASKVTSVSAGFNHSVAVCEDGSAYVWGKGMSTELKPSTTKLVKLDIYNDMSAPRLVTLPEGRRIIEAVCSNIGIVFRAHDRTLWALGIGEYDRNGIPNPIPVQEEVAVWDPDNPPPFTLADVDPSTRLVKGHNRVGVLRACGTFSEVVLHENEAYVQPMMDEHYFDGLPEGGRVVDCAIGWQHSLVAVEIGEDDATTVTAAGDSVETPPLS